MCLFNTTPGKGTRRGDKPARTGPSKDHLSSHKLYGSNKDHTPVILLSYGSYAKSLPFSTKHRFYALSPLLFMSPARSSRRYSIKTSTHFLSHPITQFSTEITSWKSGRASTQGHGLCSPACPPYSPRVSSRPLTGELPSMLA